MGGDETWIAVLTWHGQVRRQGLIWDGLQSCYGEVWNAVVTCYGEIWNAVVTGRGKVSILGAYRHGQARSFEMRWIDMESSVGK